MADMVNHPTHYNIPGRKECIEEMIDRFGVEYDVKARELEGLKSNE